MTEQQHPITPPPELIREWAQYHDLQEPEALWRTIATKAARWGADQELEACCEWLGDSPVIWRGDPEEHPGSYLREARRSKETSLKEQSLALINKIQEGKQAWHISDLNIVRRALESLDD